MPRRDVLSALVEGRAASSVTFTSIARASFLATATRAAPLAAVLRPSIARVSQPLHDDSPLVVGEPHAVTPKPAMNTADPEPLKYRIVHIPFVRAGTASPSDGKQDADPMSEEAVVARCSRHLRLLARDRSPNSLRRQSSRAATTAHFRIAR